LLFCKNLWGTNKLTHISFTDIFYFIFHTQHSYTQTLIMANTTPPQSTFVEIEPPPDISTPVWPPVLGPRMPPVSPPCAPVFYHNPIQLSPVHPGTHVHTALALAGSTPVQTLTWAPQVDNMQLCTSSEGGTPSSMAQHDLPNILHTPGRDMQQVTARVQGNWDTLFNLMTRQEKKVNELTKEVKETSSNHQSQIADLAAKMEDNKSQVFTLFTTTKQQEESEADKLMKTMKLMITGELKRVESTLVSELRFMVDQLQSEVQQDIKAVQNVFNTSQDKISSQLQQCVTQTDKCLTGFKELKSEVKKGFQSVKESADQQKLSALTPPVPSTASMPSKCCGSFFRNKKSFYTGQFYKLSSETVSHLAN